MWNPVTIAALAAAVVSVLGAVVLLLRQLQHQANPDAHAAPAARVPAPKLADPWPPVPTSTSTSPTAPDVTGLTGGADPGKPPGVEHDG